MDICMKYERSNIFGIKTYVEESKRNVTFEDVQKCFRLFKKDYTSAIDVAPHLKVSTTYYYNKLSDFEKGIVTEKKYYSYNNYTLKIVTFDEAKESVYQLFRQQEEEHER